MPEGSPAVTSGSVVFPASDYGNPGPEWLEIDWRKHLRKVELPGAEVNYAEIGTGEPIIFVHGLAGCWRNWLENLPYFGHNYRAIAIDLPGFGHSPMPSWPIDMPSYGRLIHDFCEKLGIDRVAALVGNSMGGFAATEAVIERPSRFERLVLVSAAGISFAEARGREATAFARSVKAAALVLLGKPNVHFLSRPRSRQIGFGRLVNYPTRLRPELLWEQIEPSIGAPGLAAAVSTIAGYDTRHRLPEIEIPTMIVWGLKDHIVPVEAAIGYNRMIPMSRLELFERTGHLPQMERPIRFNALLDDFLAG
jgi:pimeloyl-ACP methyl ester carboxylesterase